MFPSVRMFAVGLQSTEGELVQHACEQQNQVALTLSQTATQGATTRGSFRLSLSLRIVHPFLYCWCDPSQRLLTPRFQQGWDGRLENAQSASNFSPGYAPNVCWVRSGSEISWEGYCCSRGGSVAWIQLVPFLYMDLGNGIWLFAAWQEGGAGRDEAQLSNQYHARLGCKKWSDYLQTHKIRPWLCLLLFLLCCLVPDVCTQDQMASGPAFAWRITNLKKKKSLSATPLCRQSLGTAWRCPWEVARGLGSTCSC